MKWIDNEHLFRSSDQLQQELQLDVSEEDFDYDLMMKVDIGMATSGKSIKTNTVLSCLRRWNLR